MSNDLTYDYKKALPNKLMQDDGTLTDITGVPVVSSVKVYDDKPALPNKFLNPDGTYSTLNEIIAGMVDTSIFVIVEELPSEGNPQKIYLVPSTDYPGEFDEYFWNGSKWDKIGRFKLDLSDYSTTEQVQALIAVALQQAKDYANTNFLKKDNTTAFTPTANYHPATKKYVDDNAVSFKPFPAEFATTTSTAAFLSSIQTLNLPVGMVYLGQVSLNDMPAGVNVQVEVEVYIYPQNVVYCIMRSAEISPYEWEVNSYENRGWEPKDKTAKDYTDSNFLKKTNTTAYTPSADYNPATKKYVDDSISTSITTALSNSY